MIAFLFATVSTSFSDDVVEYVDEKYQFAFQYPRDWAVLEKPAARPEDAGEGRLFLKRNRSQIVVMVTGPFPKPVTKEKYENNPRRNELTNQMIELTIEQVYRKSALKLGTDIVVEESKLIPSDMGIQFSISTKATARLRNGDTARMQMTGIHTLPFEKLYLISMCAITPAEDKIERDATAQVLKSFRLIQ